MESSVSNVQFTERKKGFDPDEVANYLHQIDGKIAGMRAMASAAMDRAELAEERARQAERQAEQAETLAGGDAEYAARAASVLTMAQRTADATVSEARTEAARLLAEATTEAGQLTAASEAQAQQMLAEARREMEVARTEHLDVLRLEVADLEQSSDAIRAEIEVLTGTLDDERARFRQVAAALLEMADSQTGLAHGVSAGASGAILATNGHSARLGSTDTDVHESGFEAAPNPDDADAEPGDLDGDWMDEASTSPIGLADDVIGDGDSDDEMRLDEIEVDVDEIEIEVDGDEIEVDVVAATDPIEVAVDPEATVALSGLFDDHDDDHSNGVDIPGTSPGSAGAAMGMEDPTGGYADSYGIGRITGESDAESSLGPVDAVDDAAMRAFFEHDEDDDSGGSRWGRRRR